MEKDGKPYKMWDWMIDFYGYDELKKMLLPDILAVAWFFFRNPINEKEIKKIFDRNGAKFKELLMYHADGGLGNIKEG